MVIHLHIIRHAGGIIHAKKQWKTPLIWFFGYQSKMSRRIRKPDSSVFPSL